MDGIQFTSVKKSFGDVRALRSVSFDMPAAKLTGFVGPNGSGKSTSMRALLGLTPIDSGAIEVLGMTVGQNTQSIVRRVGALLEDPGHILSLTARTNLQIAAATLGAGDDDIPRVLELVSLTADADRKVNGYSKGMRQRLGLAASLLGDPDILLLDEPLDGLDPAGQVAFKDQLRMLVDEYGKTVVISSHDLNDVEQLADHVVVINSGELIAQGPTKDLIGHDAQIRIVISDRKQAQVVLHEAGFTTNVSNGTLLVDATDGAAVNATLAQAGLYADAIIPEARSLEQTFLKLTEKP